MSDHDHHEPLFPRDGALEREINVVFGVEVQARQSMQDGKLWLILENEDFRDLLDRYQKRGEYIQAMELWIGDTPESPEGLV